MTVISSLFSVHMLNNLGINVPDDFLSYAANAMFQLRLGQRTNVLYNLPKVLEPCGQTIVITDFPPSLC